MNIRFEFFGVMRGLLARRQRRLEVPDGTTIREAVERLIRESDPKIGRYMKPAGGGYAVRFSVNGRVQQDDYILAPDDVVKLLVPVGGG